MNIDPNKLTDEQLQYFLIGVAEASPCMCSTEKKSYIKYVKNLSRKQLLLDTKTNCQNGWEMSDWLNLNSIRRSLKLMTELPTITEDAS